MSTTIKKTRVVNRNDYQNVWIEKNPILLQGELGIERETRKIKIGDGVSTWDQLPYANVTDLNNYYTKDEIIDIIENISGDSAFVYDDFNSFIQNVTVEKIDTLTKIVSITNESGSKILNREKLELGFSILLRDLNTPDYWLSRYEVIGETEVSRRGKAVEKTIEKLLKTEPPVNGADVLYIKGMKLITLDGYKKALELYDKVTAKGIEFLSADGILERIRDDYDFHKRIFQEIDEFDLERKLEGQNDDELTQTMWGEGNDGSKRGTGTKGNYTKDS